MNKDITYMHRCLELAKLGFGRVSPNPVVGSVIVSDNRITGEGYHHKIGEAHAEVNAIESVKDTSLLQKSTIYINLEPCVHHGLTPPCTDRILKAGIPRVVIAMEDPNPKTYGKGIEKLKAHGVDVQTGVLKKEALWLNRRFVTYFTKNRPYIILKWAETKDGFIDVNRCKNQANNPTWITNSYGKMLVHKWRTEEDAFMVGTHTAVMDNPQLTVREWTGRNPLRVSVDFDDTFPEDLKILDGTAPGLIFTGKTNAASHQNVKKIKIQNRIDNLDEILEHLYKQKIQSIVVEGGARLLNSFISKGLWDEARIFTGDFTFKDGVKAPEIKGEPVYHEPFSNHELKILTPCI
ncbi:MAG: bifunctional diaminohydroxyphosphoribosylaminopyrimidine deaminase/5-amino-6-(5-phosphoribosylamino)uracil reductase RibD [Bacteroidales bacterium]